MIDYTKKSEYCPKTSWELAGFNTKEDAEKAGWLKTPESKKPNTEKSALATAYYSNRSSPMGKKLPM